MAKKARPSLSGLPQDLREELKHVRGHGVTRRRVKNEAEHFYVRERCRQAVDMRSLYQVLYHEDEEHEPMSESALSQTSPIEIERTTGRKRRKTAERDSK